MEAKNKVIYLDTHVLIWLYEGKIDLIPKPAQLKIEESEIFISPMVELELQYLFEIGKIKEQAKNIIIDLQARIGIDYCKQPFPQIIIQALLEDWTRDPFDRIIVSQAKLSNALLLSKDKLILKNYKQAFWN
ncbi:MAG: PIN domain-containing protein [Deltaproteobacteria bacterium]|nr:PIN domain-containing protein [Deltaproteobacteria bacterium]